MFGCLGLVSFAFMQPFLAQVSGESFKPSSSAMAGNSSSEASTSGASASSQPRDSQASSVLRALATGSSSAGRSTGVSKEIDDLLEMQKQVRAQRAQVAKDLKNAQRRKQRLKHKARLLTAADLASVLVLRQEEEEAARKRAPKRRRSSQPSQEPSARNGDAEVSQTEEPEEGEDHGDEED